MKVLVTESRRHEVMLKWLDLNYGDLVWAETERSKYLCRKKNDVYFVFEFDKNHIGDVIVSPGLENELRLYFGIRQEEMESILQEWFKIRYDIKIFNARFIT